MKLAADLVKNFFYGVLSGTLGLLPGSSSGTIAVVFKFFDRMVYSISHIFKDFKNCIKFLGPFILGSLVGVFGLASAITFLIKHFPVTIGFIFMGMIAGSIPLLWTKATSTQKKVNIFDIWIAVAAFALVITLSMFTNVNTEVLHLGTRWDWLIAARMGFFGMISGLGPIVPGMSGAALIVTLGGMGTYMGLMEGVSTFNLSVLLPYGVGMLVSMFLLAKLFTVLFRKFTKITYFVVLGFLAASFFSVYTGFNNDFESIFAVFLCAGFAVLFFFLSRAEIKRLHTVQTANGLNAPDADSLALAVEDDFEQTKCDENCGGQKE
jgi:putative membrane protein